MMELLCRIVFHSTALKQLQLPEKNLQHPSTYSYDSFRKFSGSGYLQFWTVSVFVHVKASDGTDEQLGPLNTHTRCDLEFSIALVAN